jgi:hypothetical protein
MDGACSRHGGDKKSIESFGWKDWRDRFEDIGIHGSIT